MPASDTNGNFLPAEPAGVRTGWIAAWAVAILPFLLLSYYNYPSIHDDYVNANFIAQFGHLGYIRYMYANWTGRYTEMLLKAYFNPLSYQQTVWLARLQPVVVIMLLLSGACLLFRLLLRERAASTVVAGGLLLTVLYLNGFDTAGASFYWFGGYTSYTAGAIASLFAFACLTGIYQYQHQARARRAYWLGAAGFSLLAVGTYEVPMMAIGGVVGSATLLTWLKNHPAKWQLGALLLLVLLGICAAVAAPGNQARAASVGRPLSQLLHAPELAAVGWQSGWLALRRGFHWALNPLLPLGSLLLAGLLWRVRASLPLDLAQVSPIGLALGLFSGITSLVFPSVLIYERVQAQTWQGVYFYFLLSWLSWVAVVFARFAPRVALLARLSQPGSWRWMALLFFLWCFFSRTSNTHLAYVELLTTAPIHHRLVRQREQRVREAAARHAAVVEMRPLYPDHQPGQPSRILYVIDFNDNDAAQYAHYYGVDSVLIRPNADR